MRKYQTPLPRCKVLACSSRYIAWNNQGGCFCFPRHSNLSERDTFFHGIMGNRAGFARRIRRSSRSSARVYLPSPVEGNRIHTCKKIPAFRPSIQSFAGRNVFLSSFFFFRARCCRTRFVDARFTSGFPMRRNKSHFPSSRETTSRATRLGEMNEARSAWDQTLPGPPDGRRGVSTACIIFLAIYLEKKRRKRGKISIRCI